MTGKMVPDGKGGVMKYDPNTDPHYAVAKATLEKSKPKLEMYLGKARSKFKRLVIMLKAL